MTAPGPISFSGRADAAAPSGYAEVVSPSDTVNYTEGKLARAVYVGGTGNITFVLENDTTVLVSAIPVGSIIPIIHKRINLSLTSATLIVALF